jgi:RNA polymerase sigma-70 factor (ECF subfamily)
LDETEPDLPVVTPPSGAGLDAEQLLDALAGLDEVFRAPVALFYLEDYAYQEIAEILEVPLGTVKSRIARGVRRLQVRLAEDLPVSDKTKQPSRD